MARKFLIIGATSDIVLGYLNSEVWNQDDYILAHYYGDKKGLDSFAEKCVCRCEAVEADFLSDDGIKSFCDYISEMNYVPTHILHVSALPVRTMPFRMENWSDYQNQINVQCKSFFEILRVTLPMMGKAKCGKVVSIISSCVVGVPPKGMTSYTASKYMLMGMLKSVAAEYASKNIQVNMISPSTVSTKFNENNQKAAELAARDNPLGRNATVEDVVPIIKYLLSDENTYVSGVNIPITAGEIF